mmetsp:Transcript_51055/g.136157  ORF Transcript_51055/g.136157 Transcript_51055/m.136157 type:complete len:265 (-) Transcript_51055:47-841(-)
MFSIRRLEPCTGILNLSNHPVGIFLTSWVARGAARRDRFRGGGCSHSGGEQVDTRAQTSVQHLKLANERVAALDLLSGLGEASSTRLHLHLQTLRYSLLFVESAKFRIHGSETLPGISNARRSHRHSALRLLDAPCQRCDFLFQSDGVGLLAFRLGARTRWRRGQAVVRWTWLPLHIFQFLHQRVKFFRSLLHTSVTLPKPLLQLLQILIGSFNTVRLAPGERGHRPQQRSDGLGLLHHGAPKERRFSCPFRVMSLVDALWRII